MTRSCLRPLVTGTTGTPSARASAAASTAPRRRVSSSVKVRTTHTGSSVLSTWASMRSERGRVVASRVTRRPSGEAVPSLCGVEDVGEHLLVGADRVEAVAAGEVLDDRAEVADPGAPSYRDTVTPG